MAADALHGLLQNSFALNVPERLRPMYAREGVHETQRLLRLIFEADGFELGHAEMDAKRRSEPGAWSHSCLVRAGQTYVGPLSLPFKQPGVRLPAALSWAETPAPRAAAVRAEPWEAFAFANADPRDGNKRNDFLVEAADGVPSGIEVSRLLCQLLAHRRSLLFGLPLARSTFNVLLPHALLEPEDESRGGAWLAQPALSLFRVHGRRAFRPIFSFSLFLFPCRVEQGQPQSRAMSTPEIRHAVKTPWPLATAFDGPQQRPEFSVAGPLPRYLGTTAKPTLERLGVSIEGTRIDPRMTLRSFTEATLFALSAQMTRGPGASIGERARREIGDRIVTCLSASRVSSVVVVDEDDGVKEWRRTSPLSPATPALLSRLATEVSRPIGTADAALAHTRLDQPLFDRRGYAVAVLPADRCVVTIGNRRVQDGLQTSALLEASWTACMVIGAATATGLIRSVFREIALSDRSRPDRIADIEREAMVDLHETYDIEITMEAFRNRYRLLRRRLGIRDEYKALSEKLEALYRETITGSEGRSETRLRSLTWAIVILSAFILVGTLVLIFKRGG